MNALQLKDALVDVLRVYGMFNDKYANIIKDTILGWYYTTYITAEECVDLLVEYLTAGQLSLSGKFDKKF